MAHDVVWLLPTSGDTRPRDTSDFGRAPSSAHIRPVAGAAALTREIPTCEIPTCEALT